MTARICAGPSPPPSCQLSDRPSASCTSGVGRPAEARRPGAHAGVGREAVDVVAGEPGVGDGASAASTVRSRSERPEPTPHVGLPDARDDRPPLQRLLRRTRGLTTRSSTGREEREPHVVDVLEDHAHRHADAHVVGLDVDQVGRQADVGLLVDRHPGDDVGVAPRDPLLVVDGEGLDAAAAADGLRRHVARQAARADRTRRVVEEAAVVAAQEAQDAVLAGGPEEGDVVAEARQETQRSGRWQPWRHVGTGATGRHARSAPRRPRRRPAPWNRRARP